MQTLSEIALFSAIAENRGDDFAIRAAIYDFFDTEQHATVINRAVFSLTSTLVRYFLSPENKQFVYRKFVAHRQGTGYIRHIVQGIGADPLFIERACETLIGSANLRNAAAIRRLQLRAVRQNDSNYNQRDIFDSAKPAGLKG